MNLEYFCPHLLSTHTQARSHAPHNYPDPTSEHCSVYESARLAKLAPFRASGFRRCAAVVVLPDEALFQRQAQQYASEGKSVEELTVVEMRGRVYRARHLGFRAIGLLVINVGESNGELTGAKMRCRILPRLPMT